MLPVCSLAAMALERHAAGSLGCAGAGAGVETGGLISTLRCTQVCKGHGQTHKRQLN